MSDAKRPDGKRRSAASRPGKAGKSGKAGSAGGSGPARPRSVGQRREAKAAAEPGRESAGAPQVLRSAPEQHSIAGASTAATSIRAAAEEQAEHHAEQRLGFTARRAAILAAVVCVLTLTIAGPVRTFFAQRTEMQQLAATEATLRDQIAGLERDKARLADPVFIAAQARERLGFVKPGDIPYQVQLPPGADVPPPDAGTATRDAAPGDPWYTSLWHTIADAPRKAPSDPTPAPARPAPPPPGG